MSLPAGVTTAPVHLTTPVSHSGEQLRARVIIEPSHTVIHAATGTALARVVIGSTPDPDTGTVADLPLTGQDGFTDTAGNAFKDWAYSARIEFYDSAGRVQRLLKTFQLPAGTPSLDLMAIPDDNPADPVVAAPITILSVAGKTGVVTAEQITEAQGTYAALAADPSQLFVGAVTRNAGGAPTAADVAWPDGTVGEYSGTASVTFAGAVDSYTVTHGSTTYRQPAVTRDAAGNITNRPAITIEETP